MKSWVSFARKSKEISMQNKIACFIVDDNGAETLEMLIITAIAAGLVAVVFLLKNKFVETAKSTTAGL